VSRYPQVWLRDGTPLHVSWGRPGAPPDRPGWAAPASSRVWVLHANEWWEAGEHKDRGKLARDLEVCDDWTEVVELGVVRGPAVPVKVPRC